MNYTEHPEQVEQAVMQIYDLLKELSKLDDFPAVRCNARRALGTVWQMVNHLGFAFEQLGEWGV